MLKSKSILPSVKSRISLPWHSEDIGCSALENGSKKCFKIPGTTRYYPVLITGILGNTWNYLLTGTTRYYPVPGITRYYPFFRRNRVSGYPVGTRFVPATRLRQTGYLAHVYCNQHAQMSINWHRQCLTAVYIRSMLKFWLFFMIFADFPVFPACLKLACNQLKSTQICKNWHEQCLLGALPWVIQEKLISQICYLLYPFKDDILSFFLRFFWFSGISAMLKKGLQSALKHPNL